MAHAEEAQWAVSLARSRHSTRATAQKSFDVQEKQLDESFAFQKTKLSEAIQASDLDRVRSAVRALIDLRAKQMALRLKQYKEHYGGLTETAVRREARNYTVDCTRMIEAVSGFLS